MPGDEAIGVQIVRKALEYPLRQLVNNAGLEGALIVEEEKPPSVDRDEVWVLSDMKLDNQRQPVEDFGRILDIEAQTADRAQEAFGFGRRTLWLIGVSFVVCVVGITNRSS